MDCFSHIRQAPAHEHVKEEEEEEKEVIQPHMDQPALIFISGDDSDITADENGSLDITRRKRECIGGGSPTRQIIQLPTTPIKKEALMSPDKSETKTIIFWLNDCS